MGFIIACTAAAAAGMVSDAAPGGVEVLEVLAIRSGCGGDARELTGDVPREAVVAVVDCEWVRACEYAC